MAHSCEGITKDRPSCLVSEYGSEFLDRIDFLLLEHGC